MSDKKTSTIVIRFLLDLRAEEASYVDLEFDGMKQAKRAIADVLAANGALVMVTTLHEIPVLLRSADVSAAFPIEYDADAEDEDD